MSSRDLRTWCKRTSTTSPRDRNFANILRDHRMRAFAVPYRRTAPKETPCCRQLRSKQNPMLEIVGPRAYGVNDQLRLAPLMPFDCPLRRNRQPQGLCFQLNAKSGQEKDLLAQ